MSKSERKIVWGMILVYIAVFGIFTSVRHYNFQTQTWDMGIFTQTLWNTIHGKILQNNIEEVKGPLNHLAVHMRPFILLLAPGYALFPSPYFLLWIQTIALALGALPLYLLAKNIFLDRTDQNKNLALIITAGYLLYPALHWINTFDFHEIAFLPPFLITALYFAQVKKWGWSYLFFALAASTKEDAILAVAFAGLYLLLKPREGAIYWDKEKRVGLAIFLISIFYFLIAVKIIMPALGGGLIRLDRYAQFGKTPTEIIQNIAQQPSLLAKTVLSVQKLKYVFWLFLPVAFLPFFAGPALILLIPGLAENLLTNFQSQFSGFYQYDAILIGGVFIASIYGLKNILHTWPVLAGQALAGQAKIKIIKWALIAAVAIGYLLNSPINPTFFPTKLFKSNPQWEAFRKMVKMAPPNASVAAQTTLVPHLANREHIYMLGTEPFPVDIVLIDGADLSGFTEETFQAYADSYINSGRYNFTIIDERYFILTKKKML